MSTSPFRRRPNLSKTYSKRNSLPSNSRSRPLPSNNNTNSDIAKLLMDSSEEEEVDLGENSDEDVEMRLLGRKGVEAPRSNRQEAERTARQNAESKGKRKVKDEQSLQLEGEVTKRRSSSIRTRSTKSTEEREEDSTIWDEREAMIESAPSKSRRRTVEEQGTRAEPSTATASRGLSTSFPETGNRKGPTPTRRTSPRKSTATVGSTPSSPLALSTNPSQPEESNPHSDPPSPPNRKRRKRPSTTVKSKTEEMDDTTPPPFDYVPPPQPQRSSPTKDFSPRPINPPVQPTLKAHKEAATSSAPLIRTTHPSSSSPHKAESIPRPESPISLRKPSTLRSPAITTESKRPPSPAAKDLSSLFSTFSKTEKTPMPELSGDESTSSSSRLGVSRNTSGGIVAALAAKRAGERNSRSRATTPSELILFSQSFLLDTKNSRNRVSAASPDRSKRAPLDRSLSQPSFSSPLSSPNGASPFRSPQRPTLGAASSLPDILSPSKSRSGSVSPVKTTNVLKPPALGSVYRPVSFSASTSTTGYADSGRTRTYGGERSFRPELAESDSHNPTPASKRNTLDSDSSPHLPTLPPSLTQRISKPAPAQESYAQLREKWGVAAEEELDEDEEFESQERGARVIGTGILRAQGEGKRWSDEIGWTLDGLREGKGGSGARSSALEILEKTLDREWMRRLKSSGMAEQVYLAFRRGGAGDGDRILDIALVVLLAALTRDQRLCEPLFRLSTSDVVGSSTPLSRSPSLSRDSSASPRKESLRNCEILETLVELSRREWVTEEIGAETNGKERKGKLSKSDTRHLQMLRDIIDRSDFFETSVSPVNLRMLVLQTIQAISSFVARPNFQPQQLLCTTEAFRSVLDSFLEECQPLEKRIEKYSSGLDLLPPSSSTSQSSFSPTTISICLAIFEATSLSTPYAFHLVSTPTYLHTLSTAFLDLTLAASILAVSSDSSEKMERNSKLLLSILGIIFGLATEPMWGDALVQGRGEKNDGSVGALVRLALRCRQISVSRSSSRRKQPNSEEGKGGEGEGPDEQRPEWDALCLVLGTLTNLVESNDEVKELLRETLVDPNCQSNRKCVRSCNCSSPQPVLKILCQLYLDPLDDAPNTVHQTSVAGFLRLLLGLSLVDDPRNESLILDTLILESSSTSSPISAIADALDEFAKLHEEQTKVRGMLQIENGQVDEDDEDSQMTQKDEEEPLTTMEQVGRKSLDDREGEEATIQKIRSTIQRLKRRTE
ncbi:hypothetical protein JCM5350_003341 [Sporobolomyces pararoseus]